LEVVQRIKPMKPNQKRKKLTTKILGFKKKLDLDRGQKNPIISDKSILTCPK
jgi:hypothetical protein